MDEPVGYRLNDDDVAGIVRWLQAHHPENANPYYAASFLIEMKLKYRTVGWADPDKVEDYYQEYNQKHSDQNGKTSDE